MKNYKFNKDKGDLSKLDTNELLKTLNETISLLKDIEGFDIKDKNPKQVEFKSVRWKSKTDKLEKKVEEQLKDFLEEDEENLDDKK